MVISKMRKCHLVKSTTMKWQASVSLAPSEMGRMLAIWAELKATSTFQSPLTLLSNKLYHSQQELASKTWTIIPCLDLERPRIKYASIFLPAPAVSPTPPWSTLNMLSSVPSKLEKKQNNDFKPLEPKKQNVKKVKEHNSSSSTLSIQ